LEKVGVKLLLEKNAGDEKERYNAGPKASKVQKGGTLRSKEKARVQRGKVSGGKIVLTGRKEPSKKHSYGREGDAHAPKKLAVIALFKPKVKSNHKTKILNERILEDQAMSRSLGYSKDERSAHKKKQFAANTLKN